MNSSVPEQKLDLVLHGYLQAIDAGQSPDQEELLLQHPDLASELREFFADQEKMKRFAQSVNKARLGEATIGADDSAETDKSLLRIRYFGDYELVEEIARGGMGVVYKAKQVSLNRIVALKMILAGQLASSAEVQRFRAEAEAAANLDHPNIVPIYEIGEHEGNHYFSMKLVEGGNLSALVSAAGGPSKKAIAALSAVARAVHFAHQRGILHRDLKPANILLDANDVPMVSDFGLAKRVKGGSDVTRSGAILGTPSYMAPEQARGEKGISTAVDVYSLGAILYELLTGQSPFKADTPMETLLQVIEREPNRPSRLKTGVDRDLETICLKCLEKEPAKRYPSAESLANDLDHWLRGEPIEARPVSQSERAWRWCRRNPAMAGLVAGLIIVLLAGTITSTLLAIDAYEHSRRADKNALQAKDNAATAFLRAEEAKKAQELADQEADRAKDILSRSLYEQAVALHHSHEPGRRERALDLLKEAEKLRGRPDRKTQDMPVKLPTKLELRSEAVALLLGQDARFVREMTIGTPGTGMFPAISPDGRLAAAAWFQLDMARVEKGYFGGSKGGVRIEDLSDGNSSSWEKDIHGLMGSSLCISPDNKLVASTTHKLTGKKTLDLQIELRDIWKGNVVKVLPWPKDKDSEPAASSSSARLVFSPDGRYLAGARLGTTQAEIVLLDLKSGKSRILAQDKNPPGHWVRFDSASKRLAFPTGENTVILWDLAKEAKSAVLDLPRAAISEAEFGADDQLLALSCANRGDVKKTLLVWDLAQNAEKMRFLVRGAGLLGVGMLGMSFRPGTHQLAFADGQNILLVDAHDGKEVLRFQTGHRFVGLASLSWQANGRRLISASMEGTLKIWELSEEPPRTSIVLKEDKFASFAFSPDGKWLALADASVREVSLIDRQSGAVARTLSWGSKEEKGSFFQLIFRPDGKHLAALAANHQQACVWDLEIGKEVARLEKGMFSSAAFGAKGHLLVTLTQEKKLVAWDVNEKRSVWETPATGISVANLSPDGRHVVGLHAPGVGDQSDFTVWEITSGKKSGPFPFGAMPMQPVCNVNGSLLALTYINLNPGKGKPMQTGLRLWDLRAGKKLLDINVLPISYAFSPDGQLLALATSDGTMSFWDVRSGEEILHWSSQVKEIAFTPDGHFLATTTAPAATPQQGHASLQLLDLNRIRRRLAELGLEW